MYMVHHLQFLFIDISYVHRAHCHLSLYQVNEPQIMKKRDQLVHIYHNDCNVLLQHCVLLHRKGG